MADWDISTRAAPTEFDTASASVNQAIFIDSTHGFLVWNGVASDGFARIFEANTSTGALTAPGASLEFDTRNLTSAAAVVSIDGSHVLVVWNGASLGNTLAQVMEINTSTWDVTTAAASLSLGISGQGRFSAAKIDDNHVVFCNAEAISDDGYAQTLEVNTSTWEVTTASGRFVFDTTLQYNFGESLLIDSNKILQAWSVTGGGRIQVLSVDTSTWDVSTAGALFSYGAAEARYNTLNAIDSTHILHSFTGGLSNGYIRTLSIETSTWAVSTASSDFNFETGACTYIDFNIVDPNHFVGAWAGPDNDGFTQVFEVNTSTWAVTTSAARLEFDTSNGQHITLVQFSESQYTLAWNGVDSDGFIQLFDIDIPGGVVTFVPIIASF